MKGNSRSKQTSQNINASNSSLNFLLNIFIIVLCLLILFLGYVLIVQISGNFNDEAKGEQIILPSQVQIEVLNGCGISGLADKFTELLRAEGFDVVNKGNYTSFDVDNTLIIDRSNNQEKSSMVAETIGIEKNRIVKQFNNQYFLDITLVIGKDYANLLINK